MKIIKPARPRLKLKKLVSSMGGRMCFPHARKFCVIIIGGAIRVMPIEYAEGKGHYPMLDELEDGDELKPDAKERLLAMLEDTEWTM